MVCIAGDRANLCIPSGGCVCVHDSGPSTGRAGRMRRRFPDADVVVFGHSHIPWDAEGVDGQLLFNPGSPTERRAQPRHTMGMLVVDAGRVVSHQIVAV